ncbi:alcohol dehydrogenase [Fusarium oxysporum f. sp. albedinis]|nr:alcohol dehydrogenase [Fusarium oxysporum f. sp. albedinis]
MTQAGLKIISFTESPCLYHDSDPDCATNNQRNISHRSSNPMLEPGHPHPPSIRGPWVGPQLREARRVEGTQNNFSPAIHPLPPPFLPDS